MHGTVECREAFAVKWPGARWRVTGADVWCDARSISRSSRFSATLHFVPRRQRRAMSRSSGSSACLRQRSRPPPHFHAAFKICPQARVCELTPIPYEPRAVDPAFSVYVRPKVAALQRFSAASSGNWPSRRPCLASSRSACAPSCAASSAAACPSSLSASCRAA